MESNGEAITLNPRRWQILGVMSLSLVIVMLNNVTLNVALPELSADLQSENNDLQWIVDAYVLVFGGTLLLMGALGDRFGRKRALQIGLILVACTAGWTGKYASTTEEVIGARALMGLGAALVMPATLSIVIVSFPAEERGKAIGIWAAMAGIGAPLGLLVGGWAVQEYNWQMVFWINVPVIAIALVAGFFIVPESRDERKHPLDLIGAFLSIGALTTLLYSIIEAPVVGWTSIETLGMGAASIVLLIAFVLRQNRTEYPLLPMEFFRNRSFSVGLVSLSLAFFVMFSFMFTQMLHFQLVRGHEALAAAIRFLPLPLGLMPAAANSDRLVRRFGRNRVVGFGLSLVTIAMIIFTTVEVDTEYYRLALIFFLMGMGMGLTMAPATEMVMQSIPSDKAGVGSATNDASREIGGALGIAIGGSLLNEFYQRSFTLPEGLDASMFPVDPSTSFPAAVNIGQSIGGPLGQELLNVANSAFVDGMTTSAISFAIIAGSAAIFTLFMMPPEAIGSSDSEE
jgi:EmrB/QacA subfamily drug resistance transporter